MREFTTRYNTYFGGTPPRPTRTSTWPSPWWNCTPTPSSSSIRDHQQNYLDRSPSEDGSLHVFIMEGRHKVATIAPVIVRTQPLVSSVSAA